MSSLYLPIALPPSGPASNREVGINLLEIVRWLNEFGDGTRDWGTIAVGDPSTTTGEIWLYNSANANKATIKVASLSAARTYTVPEVSADASFVMTAGAQTIAGTKTFSSTISGSIDGNAATVTNGVYTTGTQTISGTKTFDGQLIGKGTSTNDSAAAGYIGEVVSSNVTTNQSFPTSGTYGDLTSISLTAGDWDVSVGLLTNVASSSGITGREFAVTSTSGNSSAGFVRNQNYQTIAESLTTANEQRWDVLPVVRISVASTTTYYFKFGATYTGTAPVAIGQILARRRR